jgi:GntR family transcriptional regulator
MTCGLATSLPMLVRDPIYKQLNGALRALISAREFKTGDKFLSEREVGTRFGVSRATANKALAALVAEGVLRFERGVGTFVEEPKLDHDLRGLVSFTERARAAGFVPSTTVLAKSSVRGRVLDADLRQRLGVSAKDEVFRIERLRFADRVPLIFERRFVVARLCPALLEADLRGSIYALLTERYGHRLGGADQTIRAVNVGKAEADRLDVAPGSAGLLILSEAYLETGTPLFSEATLYRGDQYAFVNRVGVERKTP